MPMQKNVEDVETSFKDFPIPEETDASLSEALVSPFHSGELNSILRGEISAVEAYQKAMTTFSQPFDVEALTRAHEEHLQAVAYWKAQLRNEGEEVSEDAGMWGTMVSAFMAAAQTFGENAILTALVEGEEHGLSRYEDLLAQEILNPAQQRHIRSVCIPNQQRHIANLSALRRQ